MWKNIVQPNRPQMTIERTRIACWLTKAARQTLRICITYCVLGQQWLHERASVLRYTYNVRIVY